MDYPVMDQDKQIGRAQLTREGLYYRLVCRCKLPAGGMCRLEIQCGEKRADLGILVPVENGFGLDTHFPVNRIGTGEIVFRLQPHRDASMERIFIPLKPEEPFRYLSRLKDAFLETRGGQRGISIPKNISCK